MCRACGAICTKQSLVYPGLIVVSIADFLALNVLLNFQYSAFPSLSTLQTMNKVFQHAGDLVNTKVAHNLMRLIAEGFGEDDDTADSQLRSSAVCSLSTSVLVLSIPFIALDVAASRACVSCDIAINLCNCWCCLMASLLLHVTLPFPFLLD